MRIAKEKEHKLFVSWGVPLNFRECRAPEEMWDVHYTKVRRIIFEMAYKDEDVGKQEKIKEGDFLLKIYEVDHSVFEDFSKGASIHEYFHGIHLITELGANGVVKAFIAENENYWKPFRRMAIVVVLLFSLLFLLSFLLIQTTIGGKAIYFSFLK